MCSVREGPLIHPHKTYQEPPSLWLYKAAYTERRHSKEDVCAQLKGVPHALNPSIAGLESMHVPAAQVEELQD